MKRFIAEQNIQNFKAALARETDRSRRDMLQRLIAEEEAKLLNARSDAAAPAATAPPDPDSPAETA